MLLSAGYFSKACLGGMLLFLLLLFYVASVKVLLAYAFLIVQLMMVVATRILDCDLLPLVYPSPDSILQWPDRLQA